MNLAENNRLLRIRLPLVRDTVVATVSIGVLEIPDSVQQFEWSYILLHVDFQRHSGEHYSNGILGLDLVTGTFPLLRATLEKEDGGTENLCLDKKDNEDGFTTIAGSWRPLRAGKYVVNVKLAGQDVPGTPRVVRVQEAP